MSTTLENSMLALELSVLGPSRTITYDEWIGPRSELECKCYFKVSAAWHYCPRCGMGVRPLACVHPHGLLNEEIIEPMLVIKDGSAEQGEGGGPVFNFPTIRVECPKCHRRTKSQPRSYFAIDDWNKDQMEDWGSQLV